MPTEIVAVDAYIRDGEGTVVTVQSAQGTTEDGGVTVVVPNGYLPNIDSVPAADIRVIVSPPPVEHQPAAFVSRVDDAEANTSTITFNLNPS
jgi:hypothetical protein